MVAGADGFDRAAMRGARVRAGLTQTALAEALGTSQRQVSEWERGLQTPSPATVHRLAAALDVTVTDLLRHSTRPTLRQLRSRAGHTQAALAALAGMSRHTYARLERGEHPPRPGALPALAGALRVDLTEAAAAIERSREPGNRRP